MRVLCIPECECPAVHRLMKTSCLIFQYRLLFSEVTNQSKDVKKPWAYQNRVACISLILWKSWSQKQNANLIADYLSQENAIYFRITYDIYKKLHPFSSWNAASTAMITNHNSHNGSQVNKLYILTKRCFSYSAAEKIKSRIPARSQVVGKHPLRECLPNVARKPTKTRHIFRNGSKVHPK